MRTKRLTEQHMVRLTSAEKEKLEQTALRLGINEAELVRISLRYGLPLVLRKLPAASEEARHE